MQTMRSAERYGVERPTDDADPKLDQTDLAFSPILQHVPTGTILFKLGDQRRLYRVKRGAVCHYIRWTDGRHDVVEFAFPGDIIGLGHLSTHVSTAHAMVETLVSVVAETDFDRVLAANHLLSLRLTAAVDREFNYLRDEAMNSAKRGPIKRLACYLVAISNMNLKEGREPTLTSGEISSGYVAEELKMSIDTLSAALVSLEKMGLIAATGSRLCILDVAALETLDDARKISP
jgi:CRP/FNR family transcriptional regulator